MGRSKRRHIERNKGFNSRGNRVYKPKGVVHKQVQHIQTEADVKESKMRFYASLFVIAVMVILSLTLIETIAR